MESSVGLYYNKDIIEKQESRFLVWMTHGLGMNSIKYARKE